MTPEPLIVEMCPGIERLGIWCDRCQTSAAYEVDLLITSKHGVSRVGTVSSCARCDDEDDR